MNYYTRGYYNSYNGLYTTPRNIGGFVDDDDDNRYLILNSDPSFSDVVVGHYWKGFTTDEQPLSSLKSLIIPRYLHDTWVGRYVVYPINFDYRESGGDEFAWEFRHLVCFESPSGVITSYPAYNITVYHTPDEVGTWKVFLSTLDTNKRVANTTTYFNVLPSCGQSSSFANMYNCFTYFDVAGVRRSETRIAKIEIVDNAVSPAKVNYGMTGFRSRSDLVTFKIVTVPLPPRDRMDMVGFGSRQVSLFGPASEFTNPVQVSKVGLTINDEPMSVTLEVKAKLPESPESRL